MSSQEAVLEPAQGAIERVSIVAPMLNEADHIEAVVADIAAQDYEGELEVIVADGGSTDGSVELLLAAAKRAGLEVRVLDNPDRWVSHGLNACVREATGDLVVRIDCHSRYPGNYVRRCAEVALETGADNVGGLIVPQGHTPTQRAVAVAMSSPFGGIGWTRHSDAERVEVDTVPFGAFRPDAFRRAGLFDESLVRNQDDEFNLRLRLAGGRIVRDPSITLEYTPRGTFRGLFRQYYEYGRWKVPVMLKHRRIVSLRSLAPVALVASFALLTLLSVVTHHALAFLLGEVLAYSAGAAYFGRQALRARGEDWRLLPRVLAAFPTIHIAYGIGMAGGWLRAALGRAVLAPVGLSLIEAAGSGRLWP
jgi:glycosyltransferase involved in cell wall biosynthesis